MLQFTRIKQLTSNQQDLSNEQQRQIVGGGAGPHNVRKKSASPELWSGYASEKYDINLGTNIQFIDSVGDVYGSVNPETGFGTISPDYWGY